VSSTRAFLDITDYFGMTAELERLEPTLVVNTAALSDVDGCEIDPEKALRVNRVGPHNLARACRALGAKLVHVSTDYVFDGLKTTPYGEDDPPHPIQVYGASKRDGELAVLSETPEALIVRTSFLFGPGRATFVDRVIERARAGEKVRAVLDWVSSPTYTIDLADIIARLIGSGASGIVHASNTGSCSKFEFARAACRVAAVDDPPIEPIRLADLPLPAKRPERTPFDLTLLGALLGEPPRSWEDALSAYILGEDEEDGAA
jgi:dTDP-4-dehydrorhamnose reductase